jgi:hypothetical protein
MKIWRKFHKRVSRSYIMQKKGIEKMPENQKSLEKSTVPWIATPIYSAFLDYSISRAFDYRPPYTSPESRVVSFPSLNLDIT